MRKVIVIIVLLVVISVVAFFSFKNYRDASNKTVSNESSVLKENIVGSWVFETFNGGPAIGTLSFHYDNKFSAKICNNFLGKYNVVDKQIIFTSTSMTLMICMDELKRTTELYFGKMLNGQVSAEMTSDKLKLTDRSKNFFILRPPGAEEQNYSSEAVLNKGWNQFVYRAKRAYVTKDWDTFNLVNVEDFVLSMELPPSWIKGGEALFNNSDDIKLAEFSPGVVVLEKDQECFENMKGTYASQLPIKAGELTGELRISKVSYEKGGAPEAMKDWPGYWYAKKYCLINGDRALVVTFYDRYLKSKDDELFKKIISTVKFQSTPH